MSIFYIAKKGIIEISGADAERSFIYGVEKTAAYVVDNSGKISFLVMDTGVKYSDALGMVDAVLSKNGNTIIKTTASFAGGELATAIGLAAGAHPLVALGIGVFAGFVTENTIDLLDKHLTPYDDGKTPENFLSAPNPICLRAAVLFVIAGLLPRSRFAGGHTCGNSDMVKISCRQQNYTDRSSTYGRTAYKKELDPALGGFPHNYSSSPSIHLYKNRGQNNLPSHKSDQFHINTD